MHLQERHKIQGIQNAKLMLQHWFIISKTSKHWYVRGNPRHRQGGHGNVFHYPLWQHHQSHRPFQKAKQQFQQCHYKKQLQKKSWLSLAPLKPHEPSTQANTSHPTIPNRKGTLFTRSSTLQHQHPSKSVHQPTWCALNGPNHQQVPSLPMIVTEVEPKPRT